MTIEANIINNESGFQEIRIPEQMKIEGEKVYLKKVGNCIYIIPFDNPWKSMSESLSLFSEDFMEYRTQPKVDKRKDIE